MPRKKNLPELLPPSYPKELRHAVVLERQGFTLMAARLRADFHKRVLANDPTTGVAPWEPQKQSA